MLVVISGLSGTGKSTVGEAVARRRRAVWLSVDDVEDALQLQVHRKSGPPQPMQGVLSQRA